MIKNKIEIKSCWSVFRNVFKGVALPTWANMQIQSESIFLIQRVLRGQSVEPAWLPWTQSTQDPNSVRSHTRHTRLILVVWGRNPSTRKSLWVVVAKSVWGSGGFRSAWILSLQKKKTASNNYSTIIQILGSTRCSFKIDDVSVFDKMQFFLFCSCLHCTWSVPVRQSKVWR